MRIGVTRTTCLHCGKRADCALVGKKVGGSYRRAAAHRRCRICLPCIESLLTYATPGHPTTERWDIVGMRLARDGWPTQQSPG